MQAQKKYNYPKTRRDETFRDSHSLKDPYNWLEDPDSEETKQWVDQQNVITEQYLNECKYKEKIEKNLTEIYNYEKISCPYKRGPYYFFEKNDGLQNQHVIYMQKTLQEEPTVFLDPNKFSEDGTAALNTKKFSDSGKYFAYGVSKSGSDWEEVHIRKVSEQQNFAETLEYVKFTNFSWTKDDIGFFYGRYPKPQKSEALGKEVEQNLNYKIYYHTIGTDQSNDVLIFEMPEEPELMFDAEVTNDGQILLLKIQQGCADEHKLYYCYLSEFIKNKNSKLDFVKLIDNFESKYEYIANFGTKFYFVNNLNAPRNQVIAFDLKTSQQWEYVIKESQKDVIVAVSQINHNFMLVNSSHNVCDILQLFDFNGKFIKDIPLPPLPAIYYSCQYDQNEFFYKYVSFLSPGTIYHYSFETQESKVFKEIKIKGFDPKLYDAQQIFYESRDYTKIPMFIISKKGLQKDGQRPFQLYGYGGFNISETPYFSAIKIVLLNNLGVNLAIANIRGGGEFGEEWHQQGMKENKQNVFEDFQAAAEYLTKEKYTNPSKLVIYGGSNGGLLVAACVNQRPDLFGSAVADCGVLDMLKFHKFTIGHVWTTDFGCADNPEDFAYLIKYSPIHNVKKQKYPPVLLNTADHDDRVVPLHSYKYIAELQNKVGSESFQTDPLLIRVEVKAGHGAGKPTTKIIEEYRDIYAFIMNSLKLEWID